MSRASLWDAVIAAVCGIAPTRIRDAGFSLHLTRGVPLEEAAEQMRLFDLRPVPGTGLVDTGMLTAGGVLDLASEVWEVRVMYPGTQEPDAADWTATIVGDAAAIIGAIRPPDVWAAHADQLSVQPETAIDEIQYAEGGASRILTVRLTVRYAP